MRGREKHRLCQHGSIGRDELAEESQMKTATLGLSRFVSSLYEAADL